MPSADQLSINLATVREQWDIEAAVAGCVRAGIPAIAPWRDQVAETPGAARTVVEVDRAMPRVTLFGYGQREVEQ